MPSRIEVAEDCGLTKMTVGNIVNNLVKRGILIEVKQKSMGKIGRIPSVLDISEKSKKIISIAIRKDSYDVAVCDLKLNIHKKMKKKQMGLSSDKFFESVSKTTEGLLKEFDYNILGIGVLVDTGKPIKKRGAFKDFFEKKFSLPVFEGDYCSCLSLCENYYGYGKGFDDFMFIRMGSEISSGFILNNRLVRGRRLIPGRLGHFSVDNTDTDCECGRNGCLENFISPKIIEEKGSQILGRKADYKELCKSTENNKIDELFVNAMEKLAKASVDIVNLFDPKAIILGDMGMYLPKKYLSILEDEINLKKYTGNERRIRVYPPFFKSNEYIKGAASFFADRIFEGEIDILPNPDS